MTPDRLKERKSEQDKANLSIAKWELNPDLKDEFPSRQPKRQPRETEKDKADFFKEAGPSGTLSADWRATTENVSPMVKKGGVVVDCGGSSGRYAEFLALSRPDLKIISIEPDPVKFKMAQEEIKKAGLESRVTLINKPVPEALDQISKSGQKVDMVTSLYRTHLQTDAENNADFAAMAKLNRQNGASVMTLDLHRARRHETAEAMPKVFPDDSASQEFRDGYEAALKYGAYRGQELEAALKGQMGQKNWDDRVAGVVGQLQIHILTGPNAAKDGAAPKPNYPPTSPEYIQVANDMNLIMNLGKYASMPGQALETLGNKVLDASLSLSNQLSQVFGRSKSTQEETTLANAQQRSAPRSDVSLNQQKPSGP